MIHAGAQEEMGSRQCVFAFKIASAYDTPEFHHCLFN